MHVTRFTGGFMKVFMIIFFSVSLTFFSIDIFADTQEACRIRCNNESTDISIQSGCFAKNCSALDSAKEKAQLCSSATEKWKSAIAKHGDVCSSFSSTGSSKDSCLKKINDCSGQVASLVTPGSDKSNSIDDLFNQAMGIFKASQDQQQQTGKSVNESCYQFSNEKIEKANEKREEKISKIREKIEDQQKKQNEANEKLSKETSEIKADQQKLNAELKKTLQKLEVTKREKFTKINEEIQANSTSIRKLSTEIIKSKQAAEKVKFEHQKKMLEYTEDKINQQCKSAIDTAKICFIKASKGMKFTEKDTCSNFSLNGTGTKGTAELKKKLKQVSDACFEQSNQSVSTKKYEYADFLRNSDMEIKEKQEQISDANKSLELKKTEFDSVTKENEKEKSDEEQNVQEQMTNLTQKLQALQENIEKTKATAQVAQDKLNQDLAALTAVKINRDLGLDGGESNNRSLKVVTDEARNALNDINNERLSAFDACGCGATEDSTVLNKAPKKDQNISRICTQLSSDPTVDKIIPEKSGNKKQR